MSLEKSPENENFNELLPEEVQPLPEVPAFPDGGVEAWTVSTVSLRRALLMLTFFRSLREAG